MKKIITLVAVMALALCACFAVACSGGNEAVGTWKVESLSMSMGGVDINVAVGEDAPWGGALTEDAFILEIKEDGTIASTSTMEGETMSQTGTWTEADGAIAITIEGSTQNAEIKDGKLVLSVDMGAQGSMSYTFKKA